MKRKSLQLFLGSVLFSGGGVFAVENSIRETCADFLSFTRRWEHLSSVYDETNQVYPANPVARALELRRRLPFVYAKKSVPVRVEFGGKRLVNRRGKTYGQPFEVKDRLQGLLDSQVYADISVLPDSVLNSLRYVSRVDIEEVGEETIPVGAYAITSNREALNLRKFEFAPHLSAQAIIDWGAGLTGLISHSGRVFKQLSVMNSRNPESFVRRFLGDTLWVDTAAVSIDKPFHGPGPFDPKYRSLSATLDWRKAYFESLRTKRKPVIAACRSGESIPLAQLNFENPGLLDGLIWMAPMHPVEGYRESILGYVQTNRETLAGFKQGSVEAEPVILSQSFEWFTGMRDELVSSPQAWFLDKNPLGETPVLILVGENDPEVSEPTRAYYRALSRRFPDQVFYVQVKGAPHDVFSVTEDTYGNVRRFDAEANVRAAKVWAYVYWFIQSKVLKQSSKPPPDYGWLFR